MYETVPFLPEHIFSLDLCNLDGYTENFSLDFYFYYLLNHNTEMYITKKDYTESNELYSENIVAYIIGSNREEELLLKDFKGNGEKYTKVLKTHVSALTVAPTERKRGLGTILMNLLEENGNFIGSMFCDLYVKVDNLKAIEFYRKSGYFVYRKVFEYYTCPMVDAYDMRKSLWADRATCKREGCSHEECGYFNGLIGKDIHQSEL